MNDLDLLVLRNLITRGPTSSAGGWTNDPFPLVKDLAIGSPAHWYVFMGLMETYQVKYLTS